MRDRFRDLFRPALFLALYAELLQFLFLLRPVLSGSREFALRQGLYSGALIFAGIIVAAAISVALAFAQIRWPRLDVALPRGGLALCLVLAILAYFVHLFPGALDPLMPQERNIDRLIAALETIEQKNTARFVQSLVHQANVDAALRRYQVGSLVIAAGAWVILLTLGVYRGRARVAGTGPSVLRHPIAVAGFAGFALLSLLQVWPN